MGCGTALPSNGMPPAFEPAALIPGTFMGQTFSRFGERGWKREAVFDGPFRPCLGALKEGSEFPRVVRCVSLVVVIEIYVGIPIP